MSIRTDSGVCRYCGMVLHVEKMKRLEGPPAYDAFACPECFSEAPRKGAD